MGDMNKEPSMEEILSSIKRIIAEDAENALAGKPRAETKARARRDIERETHRKTVIASMVAETSEEPLSYVDEVLELTDEMPRLGRGMEMEQEMTSHASARSEAVTPVSIEASESVDPIPAKAPAAESSSVETSAAETIVSVESEVAARTSLAALSSMMLRSPDQSDSNTLEGLVREMLRPMLKDWLDNNLPPMVEGMVAREIARITGRPL